MRRALQVASSCNRNFLVNRRPSIGTATTTLLLSSSTVSSPDSSQRRHNFWFSCQNTRLQQVQDEENFTSDFWVSLKAPQAIGNLQPGHVMVNTELESQVEYYNLQDLLDAKTGVPLMAQFLEDNPGRPECPYDMLTRKPVPERALIDIQEILQVRGLAGAQSQWWLRRDDFGTRKAVCRRGALSVVSKATRPQQVVNVTQLVDPNKVLDVTISGATRKVFSTVHPIQDHRRGRRYESNVFFTATQAKLLGLTLRGKVDCEDVSSLPLSPTSNSSNCKEDAGEQPGEDTTTVRQKGAVTGAANDDQKKEQLAAPLHPCTIHETDFWIYNMAEFEGWEKALARMRLSGPENNPAHAQLLHNRQEIQGQLATKQLEELVMSRRETLRAALLLREEDGTQKEASPSSSISKDTKNEGGGEKQEEGESSEAEKAASKWWFESNFWVTSEVMEEMRLKLKTNRRNTAIDTDSSSGSEDTAESSVSMMPVVARIRIGSNAYHSPTKTVQLFNLCDLEDPLQGKKAFGCLVR